MTTKLYPNQVPNFTAEELKLLRQLSVGMTDYERKDIRLAFDIGLSQWWSVTGVKFQFAQKQGNGIALYAFSSSATTEPVYLVSFSYSCVTYNETVSVGTVKSNY